MKDQQILIVEDELMISEMLKEVIFDYGYRNVEQATSYSEALMLLAQKKWDLVFLDIHLGSTKDGVDVAGLIQTKYKVPFVFVTSYGDPDSIARAVQTRPEAYLTKPFKPSDVFATMQMIFSKSAISKSIVFREGYIQERVLLNDVLFLKADNIYVELHTEERTYLIRSTLESFLIEHGFTELMRVHRSYAVNTTHVHQFNGASLVIAGMEIPVSRKYKPKILEELKKKIPINT